MRELGVHPRWRRVIRSHLTRRGVRLKLVGGNAFNGLLVAFVPFRLARTRPAGDSISRSGVYCEAELAVAPAG
jgi:hypothetical protein